MDAPREKAHSIWWKSDLTPKMSKMHLNHYWTIGLSSGICVVLTFPVGFDAEPSSPPCQPDLQPTLQCENDVIANEAERRTNPDSTVSPWLTGGGLRIEMDYRPPTRIAPRLIFPFYFHSDAAGRGSLGPDRNTISTPQYTAC